MDLHDMASHHSAVVETTELDETATAPSRHIFQSAELPDPETPTFDGRPLLAPQSMITQLIENNDSNSSAFHFDNAVEITDRSSTATGVRVVIPNGKFAPLPYASSRSGIVYDVRMRYHVEPPPDVEYDAHPEKPGRILEIYQELQAAGLTSDSDEYGVDLEQQFKLIPIAAREATLPEIRAVHSEEHVQKVRDSQDWTLEQIKSESYKSQGEDSIYWHNLTYMCARLSAGGAIEATKAVVSGHVRNAVGIIRPPGHHAEHDKPTGFCFFNNVAIAARAVQRELPNICRKIVVLDWDVHHGNGIQHAFYNDPNVLYISLHVYQNADFYPHNIDANSMFCGEGPGLGYNVNIPWRSQGRTDADYMLAFQQIVMPICVEFNPDLVMISAGFDAAFGDPLGGCYVSPAGYAHMTHMLMQLAHGKVVACLEGGYNLRAISKSALAMTRTLMGEPPERLEGSAPTDSAISTVHEVIRVQAEFWKSLHPKTDIRLNQKLGSQRLHDIVREWQSRVLWENHKMMELSIMRKSISRSYKDQVLATQDFYEAKPLLIIFHDPPNTQGLPDPLTNQLQLHNTWLTDVSKSYVDWAVKHGFAVIDVNVPKYITLENEEESSYVETDAEKPRAEDCREIAFYLWNNYVELGDAQFVFLMGVGDAYYGLAEVLRTHPNCLGSTDLVVGFIAEHTIRSVSDPDNPAVARAYRDKSMIFVSHGHTAFIAGKKLKNRHGNIIQSPSENLQEMLQLHHGVVTSRLLEITKDWQPEESKTRSEKADDSNEHDLNVMSPQNHDNIRRNVTEALGKSDSLAAIPHGKDLSDEMEVDDRPSLMSSFATQAHDRGGPPLGLFPTTATPPKALSPTEKRPPAQGLSKSPAR